MRAAPGRESVPVDLAYCPEPRLHRHDYLSLDLGLIYGGQIMGEEKVKWKIDGIFKADAQKVYSEIGDMQTTPEDVLRKAEDPESELHKCFEWNDSKAAEKYRLVQAREILRSIVYVEVSREDAPLRVFHTTEVKHVYQPTTRFLVNHDEYQNLLKRAQSELAAFKQKYKTLSELDRIFEEIDQLLAH